MTTPRTAHVYSHSRILQIIPANPPAWVVYRGDSAEEPIFASPVFCWALVEEWQSVDHRQNGEVSRIDRQKDGWQDVRPMTCVGDENVLEVDKSENIICIASQWPPTPNERASLIASLAPPSTREP